MKKKKILIYWNTLRKIFRILKDGKEGKKNIFGTIWNTFLILCAVYDICMQKILHIYYLTATFWCFFLLKQIVMLVNIDIWIIFREKYFEIYEHFMTRFSCLTFTCFSLQTNAQGLIVVMVVYAAYIEVSLFATVPKVIEVKNVKQVSTTFK